MKRAIIVLNGNLSNLKNITSIIKNNDLIISVDGGTKHLLKYNILPNIVIGDFDSLDKSIIKQLSKKRVEFLRFPQEKDKTDSQLAIELAIKKGFKEILLFGFLGDRLDHLIANILYLANLNNYLLEIKIIEGSQEIYFVSQKISLFGKKGDRLSLIPLYSNVYGVKTLGMKYKLNNEILYFGQTRGISNELTKAKAEIRLKKGKLLVVHTAS